MTPWEEEQEKQDAEIWKRPRRTFIFDKPFYPDFPPEPKVNFELNYQ
uniref:TT viral ORF2 n=1 Tax=Anelloviridae sp. ctq1T2 TaxID=2828023 RepID=A0A8S5RX24_9VIRU|nr:MAG TPA: TT viral ORF2 [Anelloviridae sp. ctq1T2]